MNRYKLTHITTFEYDGPVSGSRNEVRLRPMQDESQSCLWFRLQTEPASEPTGEVDFLGNWVYRFQVAGEHRRLRIEAESVVRVLQPMLLSGRGPQLEELVAWAGGLREEFSDFLMPTGYVPHAVDVVPLIEAAVADSDGSALGYVEAVTAVIHRRFRYRKGATRVTSSILDALLQEAGVCQDFAHLLLAAARMKGLPARYVSGYLVPRRTAEPGASFEEVVGGQASHAWAEVYVPEVGWVPQDPTLGRPVGLQHVRIAYGRDYGDVTPVRGVYKGYAGQRLSVDVRVRPAMEHEEAEDGLGRRQAATGSLPGERGFLP